MVKIGDIPEVTTSASKSIFQRAMVAYFVAGVAVFSLAYAPQGLLPEISKSYLVSPSTASLVIGATTMGIAFGVIPWGRFSNQQGRIRPMRWALASAVVISFFVPFINNYAVFVGVRFIEGIALAGIPAIGIVSLSETLTGRQLSLSIAALASGSTFGGMLGRILAAFVSEASNWITGLLAVSILVSVLTGLFWVFVPKTNSSPNKGTPTLLAIWLNLRTQAVVTLLIQGFLLMGGMVAAFNYISFKLIAPPYSLNSAQISLLFLTYFIGSLMPMLAWRMTRRMSPSLVIMFFCSLMLGGILITELSSLPLIVAGLVLFTMGFTGSQAMALGLIIRRAEIQVISVSPSMYHLACYSGSAVVGWLSGVIFLEFSWPGVATVISLCTLTVVLLTFLLGKKKGGISFYEKGMF